jgi:hypothetical protein
VTPSPHSEQLKGPVIEGVMAAMQVSLPGGSVSTRRAPDLHHFNGKSDAVARQLERENTTLRG